MRIWLFAFLIALLFACKSIAPAYLSGENKAVNKDISADSSAVQFISPWQNLVKNSMHAFVGLSDTTWSTQARTGSLGQLVADCGIEKAKKIMLDSFGILPHCAIYNFGGIRNSLPKDSIFNRDIFECLPFQNEIVVMNISGATMDSVLNLISTKNGEPVSGIGLHIQNKKWVMAEIADLPFDSRREYWIVVNDFMANGGDGYTMLKYPILLFHTGIPWRDAVTELIKSETESLGKMKRRNISRIIIKN